MLQAACTKPCALLLCKRHNMLVVLYTLQKAIGAHAVKTTADASLACRAALLQAAYTRCCAMLLSQRHSLLLCTMHCKKPWMCIRSKTQQVPAWLAEQLCCRQHAYGLAKCCLAKGIASSRMQSTPQQVTAWLTEHFYCRQHAQGLVHCCWAKDITYCWDVYTAKSHMCACMDQLVQQHNLLNQAWYKRIAFVTVNYSHVIVMVHTPPIASSSDRLKTHANSHFESKPRSSKPSFATNTQSKKQHDTPRLPVL